MTDTDRLAHPVLEPGPRRPIGAGITVDLHPAGQGLLVTSLEQRHQRRVRAEMAGIDDLDAGAGGEIGQVLAGPVR